MKSKPHWHIHDKILLEWNTEPISERIKYIRGYKPKDQVELRIKLLKEVRGKLPAEVIKAGDAYVNAWIAFSEARAVYDKRWAACKKTSLEWLVSKKTETAHDKAWWAYKNVLKKHSQAINKLHAKECPNCPWNGKTIFPEKQVK